MASLWTMRSTVRITWLRSTLVKPGVSRLSMSRIPSNDFAGALGGVADVGQASRESPSGRAGVRRANRIPAEELLRIAVSGCFNSCVRVAVSSPRVATRATCSSSCPLLLRFGFCAPAGDLGDAPPPELDNQREDANRLRRDHRDGGKHVPPVPFPRGGLTEQHHAPRRQPAFADPPARQLAPVVRGRAQSESPSAGNSDAGSPRRIRAATRAVSTPFNSP